MPSPGVPEPFVPSQQGVNPFGMMNSLADFQNKMNENRMFQAKFMAAQSLGEIIAHSDSLEDGINTAMKNPMINAFGGEPLANARTLQNLDMQRKEVAQRIASGQQAMAQSGYNSVLQAGLMAIASPERTHEIFKNALLTVDPSVRDRVAPQVQAMEDAFAAKIGKYDLNTPTGYKAAQDAAKAVFTGPFLAAGGDLGHITPWIGTTQLTPEGYPLHVPGVMEGGAMPSTPAGGPTGGAAPPAPGATTTGSEQNPNPVSGKPYDMSDINKIGFTAPDYLGRVHLSNPSDEKRNADAIDDYDHKETPAYNGALNTQAQIAQVLSASQKAQDAGAWYTPGAGASARLELSKFMQAIHTMTGQPPSKEEIDRVEGIQSMEDVVKLSQTMAFQQENMFQGEGRKAYGLFVQSLASVPGLENSPGGIKILSAGIQGFAKYMEAKHNFKNEWLQNKASHGVLPGAEEAFNKQSPPLSFINAEFRKEGLQLAPDGQLKFNSLPALDRAFQSGWFGDQRGPAAEVAIKRYSDQYDDLVKRGLVPKEPKK